MFFACTIGLAMAGRGHFCPGARCYRRLALEGRAVSRFGTSIRFIIKGFLAPRAIAGRGFSGLERIEVPIYAYRCAACGFEQDVLQKMSDAALTTCPSCGAHALKKQVTAAGFQLKGSGWYATDFRDSGTKPKGAKSEDATPASADAKGKGDEGAKPAASPADGEAKSESKAQGAPAATPAAPAPAPSAAGPAKDGS
jgi:putative FmdB family regulatory protein